MKKIVILLVVTMMITGCSSEKKQKQQLDEAGRQYYEKYMSALKGIDEAEISLGMLNKVNDEKKEEYKLNALKNCKDTTQVVFTIKDGKIESAKYELKCD